MILGIYGAGGLGTEYENLAERINEIEHRWDGIIFVDDTPSKKGQKLVDVPIMDFEQAINQYGLDGIEFILAIGEPAGKEKVFKKLCESDAHITCLIYPDFVVPRSIKYGVGLVVNKNTGLPTCSEFGNNVLVQDKAVMGHNLKVGDNVVLSSLSFVGGNVKIGKNTYVAPGAMVRDGLTIGENAIIGMGAVVTKDVPDNAVVYGNPAKVMRYNEQGCVFNK